MSYLQENYYSTSELIRQYLRYLSYKLLTIYTHLGILNKITYTPFSIYYLPLYPITPKNYD